MLNKTKELFWHFEMLIAKFTMIKGIVLKLTAYSLILGLPSD
jgi:hypothetical protein